jgi:glycosyltransferase involved in cell wall biosynthesis
MANRKKTIGIDARLYGPDSKGLGRYVEEIVNGVTDIDREHDFVIFLGRSNFDSFASNNANVKKVMADAHWYTLREQVIMPYLIWREKIDLMHFPHFNVPIFCMSSFVVTIHDLILTKYPSRRASTLSPFAYRVKYLLYKLIIWTAIKRSRKIIAVSEYTKNDIISKFDVESEKITVTYEGISEKLMGHNNLDESEVLNKYGIKKPFVMYVGNAYPHKNLEELISEFIKRDKKYADLKLVLVGGEDYFYKRLKNSLRPAEAESIIFTGYVIDGELSYLYRAASAYIFPSRYEGFGLPPLEAMTFGALVLSSNKTCLPEILGDAAVFFDPDEAGWLNKALEVLADAETREKHVKRGYLQAQKYHWDDCAEKTLKIYRDSLK